MEYTTDFNITLSATPAKAKEIWQKINQFQDFFGLFDVNERTINGKLELRMKLEEVENYDRDVEAFLAQLAKIDPELVGEAFGKGKAQDDIWKIKVKEGRVFICKLRWGPWRLWRDHLSEEERMSRYIYD